MDAPTAAQLSAATRADLTKRLTVTLSTELESPRARFHPPGAQDYYATLTVGWGLGGAYTEQDRLILASLARDAGADPEQERVQVRVGHAHLLIVDLDEPAVYEALDAREADTEYLASQLFDDDGLLPELQDDIEVTRSAAVLVNFVTVDPAWRGLRLGLVGTGLVLAELRRGCAFAALDAMAPGLTGTGQRDAAHRRLAAYWSRLGFTPWKDRVMVLDLSRATLDGATAAIGEDSLGG